MKNNYKFRILLFLFFFGSAYLAKANVDTVLVGQSGTLAFSPSNFTTNVGDTILWLWESGSHTTTSTNVPPGAASWNQSLNSSSSSFMYVPAVAGTYSYQCTPHSSMMKGTFTVLSTTGLDEQVADRKLEIYPSIGNGSFRLSGISDQSAVLKVYSSTGELMMEKSDVKELQLIDLEEMANGIYFVYLISEQQRSFAKYIKK